MCLGKLWPPNFCRFNDHDPRNQPNLMQNREETFNHVKVR